MPGSVSDEAFARAAQQAGMVAFDDIEAARAIQADSAKKGVLVSLPDVLIQQGVITAKTRENIERKALAQQTGGIKQLGPYKLLKKLGEGGMGAVYLADDTSVGRKVAVKVLPKKYSEEREFLTRFRREAQATGKLNHVNIVMAYNVGEDAGAHYYAMEYCEGDTLDRILKRDKVIPWDAAVGVVLQVARGLKHAHEHGIIHRDIKPANLFVCKPLGTVEGAQVGTFAEGFVAKILDLGLSKNISGDEQSFYTQTGVALGTPHYISPEQAKGEKGIDGRTDIYSLGATFYHLVTGQTPFQGSTAALIMMKHLNDQLPNPQDINPDIPDGVAQVIAKMMAKEPADRYANCRELLDDLGLVIDGKAPSSQAIDVGKSSVAVARGARRVATAPRKTAGPLPPVGTRQHPPVAERRSAMARHVDDVPLVEITATASSRKPMYIGLGVLGLGAITFIAALAMRGTDNSETRNSKSEGNEKVSGQSSVVSGEKTPNAVVQPDTRSPIPEARPVAVQPETVNLKPETRQWPLHDGKEPIADYAKRVGLPATETLDLGGGVKMEFVLVPAGEFVMGVDDDCTRLEEQPIHKVKISKPYYIGKYDVTVAQFRAFADAIKYQTEAEKQNKGNALKDGKWGEWAGVSWRNPGYKQEDNHPVVLVTWNDAQDFCQWTAKKADRAICLPTEAQWEHACRAGTTTKFSFGDTDSDLSRAGWHLGNSGDHPHPVGEKMPNAWGLYDMHGNVAQWVQDYFSVKYYSQSPLVDPRGPASGQGRVARGGSWANHSYACRSGRRSSMRNPNQRESTTGFRVALDVSAAAVQPQATNQKPETGVTDAWIKSVQAQPAEKQVEEVVKKLKELNAGYDGKELHSVQNGTVAKLTITGAGLKDISPVRAFRSLSELECADTAVCDLTPLNGMPLTSLGLNGTAVSDLSPLRDMALQYLRCASTKVGDLSPLKGMPLVQLSADGTPVSDLSPLKGMRLAYLRVARTAVTDLSPLRQSPLKELRCSFVPERDAAILRSIKTLEKINDMPVAEFWKKYPDDKLETRNPKLEGNGKTEIAKADAGAERPWKPIFDGKTLECLRRKGEGGWRVENDAIVNVAGKHVAAQTVQDFGDGEMRIRFEISGGDWVNFCPRQGQGAGDGVVFSGTDRVNLLVGKTHELVFKMRGEGITATMDGPAIAVNLKANILRGPLQFSVNEGTLRVLSIECRELAPATPLTGTIKPDAGAERPWKAIFDGKTLECLEQQSRGMWKVDNGALANLGNGGKFITQSAFENSELRVRFEVKDCVYMNVSAFAGPVFEKDEATFDKSQLARMSGKSQELCLVLRHLDVSATINGQPVPFVRDGNVRPRRNLVFNLNNGSLRVLSIEYRELDPDGKPQPGGQKP